MARVLPLFYAALIAGTMLLVVFGHSGYAFDDLPGFLQNALLLKGTGVLWSIPVEIHFYALFVLIWAVWNTRGANPMRGPLLLVALLAVQMVAVFALRDRVADHNYLLFWLHFFLLGFVAAQVWQRRHVFGASFAPTARITGLLSYAALGVSIVLLPWFREAFGWTLPPIFMDPFVILAILVTFAFTLGGLGPYAVLRHPVMRRLGDWSFGIYLIHAPVIFLAEGVGLKDRLGTVPALLVIVAATVGAAAVARIMIELPLGQRCRAILSGPRPVVVAAQSDQKAQA